MNNFNFCDLEGTVLEPKIWLQKWAALYPQDNDYDSAEHDYLIARRTSFSERDFERIGKWKDNAHTENRWKENVASVAYVIWMQAASELPVCPQNGVTDFLKDWSERRYTDKYDTGQVREKRFGLSRATALLYFISGGRFPIFDKRVRTAIKRLVPGLPVPNNVPWYVDSYCSLFSEIGLCCAATNRRDVDKALFSFGGRTLKFIKDRPETPSKLT